MNQSRLRTLLIWFLLIAVFVIALNSRETDDPVQLVSFDIFRAAIEQSDVATYTYEDSGIRFSRNSIEGVYFARIDWAGDEWSEELAQQLNTSGAEYVDGSGVHEPFRDLIMYLIILLVGLLALVFFIRKIGGGGGMQNIFALRTSKARVAEESSKVQFSDIGGCVEAKQELADLVSFLKEPQRWTDAGARLPRGVLLEGPPGCGKTLLARAVAGETDAKFYYTSASEFVEMFIGVGPARVRDMFETAKKEAPAVLFIDELDAIGRRRGSGVGFANEEREQTLNQILVSMDGFEPAESVVVIAATNRADILDKALVRAGRFDRRIKIDPLEKEQRLDVLKIHTREKRLADSVSLEEVSDWTDGFTGADLETLTNRAALLAVRRASDNGAGTTIEGEDFRLALKMRRDEERSFDALDAVLLEATTQLAEPVARAMVRITLLNNSSIEGEVLWIDPNFVKVRRGDSEGTSIIPKTQICQMEALEGTAQIAADEMKVDRSLSDRPTFG